MDFTRTLSYPALPDEVAAMCLDEAYSHLRASKAGMSEVEVSTRGTTVTTTIVVPTQNIPQIALMRLPEGARPTLVLTDTWARGEDGLWHGTFSVEVPHMPVEARAESVLRPTGQTATLREMTGQVHVRVPLFGPRIETQVLDRLDVLLRAEVDCATEWLARPAL
ncbi:DUF2505 domain-containing protein [Schaalia sp. 19OD2882]|uniref:DUF2505 domain-containing protein n=1 Tax=Schaalia sp. 19OD2882 TaxID=2794089 RepID=UPI001C1EAF64|nr:DUF2505 domain-containing protein [Schaalia sp. 19OD2882]QWW19135.1 DUF2505 domain-containing protein [Schaalia sp. 19OD2882]